MDKNTVEFTAAQWCERWGTLCGVTKVKVVAVHTSIGCVTVRYYNNDGTRHRCTLFPGDVAEVIGFISFRVRAKFDNAAKLTIKCQEV